uniref:Uncharacterized protein n=1 Tax=Glossina pallidipes TaxID=7398 RepID=A0A1A9ZAI3_GLOPL
MIKAPAVISSLPQTLMPVLLLPISQDSNMNLLSWSWHTQRMLDNVDDKDKREKNATKLNGEKARQCVKENNEPPTNGAFLIMNSLWCPWRVLTSDKLNIPPVDKNYKTTCEQTVDTCILVVTAFDSPGTSAKQEEKKKS